MVDKEDFELENNEHVIVHCSNCDKPLVDVWVTRSEYPVKNQIRASCCFCDDDSFIVDVDGAFHLGGCDGVGIGNIDTTVMSILYLLVFNLMVLVYLNF